MTKKAHDMIAKGIETGDMELVRAGHDLLKKSVKKPVKKKAPTKKKKAPPKKRLTKPKPELILTEDSEQDDDDFGQFKMKIRSDESKRQRPDGKKVARVEQVDLSKIGKSNSFDDDGEIAPTSKIEKKLYRMRPVPRREAVELTMVKCENCDRKRPMSQKIVGKKKKYVCDNCIKEKGRYKP